MKHARLCAQDELLRNRCPAGRLDVWQRGVDTEEFHPRHRSAAMRERMSGGRPDSLILVYIGRLGPGTVPLFCITRHTSWHCLERASLLQGILSSTQYPLLLCDPLAVYCP
jgi:hypothetical protein